MKKHISKSMKKMSGISNEMRIQKLFLNDIVVHKQIRKNFDGIEELATNILSNGLLSPITVLLKDGEYILHQGERRFRAHRILVSLGHDDFDMIDCRLVDFENDQLSFFQQYSENSAREDLTAIEHMEAAISFRDNFDSENGWQTRLADKIGKGRSFVSRHCSLEHVSDDVLDLCRDGLVASVQSLLKIDKFEHKDELIKALRDGSSLIDAFSSFNPAVVDDVNESANDQSHDDGQNDEHDDVQEEQNNDGQSKEYVRPKMTEKNIDALVKYIMENENISDYEQLLVFLDQLAQERKTNNIH